LPQQKVQLDSGILQPHEVSDHEWKVLFEIEDRLRDVERHSELYARKRLQYSTAQEPDAYEFKPKTLAPTEKRYQRVLLLDGKRGTGKTSFILTLINRWHGAAKLPDTVTESWEPNPVEVSRVLRVLNNSDLKSASPTNVRVLRNLDFDPLPSRMPVIAAIVQAWRPLVELYDMEAFGGDDLCDPYGGRRLMDSWHALFRVAATGWSELPANRGLIEQVLDREEQVKDWQYLREYWLWFVERVIDTGYHLKSKYQLDDNPVFVIIIDDVDLQVERVRELLPALRMLSHPNVFFIVAADRRHLVEMLKLDYFGQQQRIAVSHSDGLEAGKKDIWASELAHAAFEKVFPIHNRWHLELLPLPNLLNHPPAAIGDAGERRTLGSVLREIRRRPNTRGDSIDDQHRSNDAEAAIRRLAVAAQNASVSLPALSYRSAQQLWQTVSGLERVSEQDAAAILARLASPDPLEPAEVLEDPAHTIFVPNAGGVAATYEPMQIDPGGQENVVVSARPDFRYVPLEGRITRIAGRELTARLIGSTLQELNFPLSTASAWDARLAFAWTEWPHLNAVFAWPWHTHPRPDELLEQTQCWSNYLGSPGAVEKSKIRERYAYAWVYFELQRYFRRWGIKQPETPDLDPSLLAEHTSLPWDRLLAFVTHGAADAHDRNRWGERTIPLLARPEIGLDPTVQKKLFNHSTLTPQVIAELRDQRRKLATDAVIAAQLRHNVKDDGPTQDAVDAMLERIEAHHRASYKVTRSLWFAQVGITARRTVRERGQKGTTRRARS
jgi:hypothetical protein